jgi:hypothetical protein
MIHTQPVTIPKQQHNIHAIDVVVGIILVLVVGPVSFAFLFIGLEEFNIILLVNVTLSKHLNFLDSMWMLL